MSTPAIETSATGASNQIRTYQVRKGFTCSAAKASAKKVTRYATER